MPLHIHSHIASLIPYVPGKPIDELERELGIPRAIKLASNENPLGPSPKALAVLAETAATLHRYPDGGAHRLRAALADRYKLTPDHVLLGNGSDEILGLLARAFLSPSDEAVMADQTFVIYKMEVTAAHGKPVIVPLKQWRHDLPAMAGAITNRTRLVFICNPNNPTGTMATADDVIAFMHRIPDDVIVIFDEAYYEYVQDQHFPDSLNWVTQRRNAIVLRTFSKIYGLAGLRVGYGLTTPEIAGYLNRIRPPFNVNTVAQRAALAALTDDEHVARSRALNAAEMATVRAGLVALGFQPVPSQTNFLLFDVGRDGRVVFEALLRQGVIVRHIEGRLLRVTIGLPEENRYFLDALKKVLS
ncbi:MAG: histidinol-phosphate transaminase [Nitrospirales bacterium]|nr:histidinol-phosphate transaminase [Nitrospirales bacterium]